MPKRRCAWCGAVLHRKPGESPSHWDTRLFCGRSCWTDWRTGRSRSDTVGLTYAVDPRTRQRGQWTPEALGALAAQTLHTEADEQAFARAWATWRTKGEAR